MEKTEKLVLKQKQMISKWHAEHPFVGQNAQQSFPYKCCEEPMESLCEAFLASI